MVILQYYYLSIISIMYRCMLCQTRGYLVTRNIAPKERAYSSSSILLARGPKKGTSHLSNVSAYSLLMISYRKTKKGDYHLCMPSWSNNLLNPNLPRITPTTENSTMTVSDAGQTSRRIAGQIARHGT